MSLDGRNNVNAKDRYDVLHEKGATQKILNLRGRPTDDRMPETLQDANPAPLRQPKHNKFIRKGACARELGITGKTSGDRHCSANGCSVRGDTVTDSIS